MARFLLNQEEGIQGHRPWNNLSAWGVSTGEHVTIRHTAATSVSAAIHMICPSIGNVLGVSAKSPNHQMRTLTSMVNADSPLQLSDKVPHDVVGSHVIPEEEPLMIPLPIWILRISQTLRQHPHPLTRQVVFCHRLAEDRTHSSVCAELMRNKQQDRLILRTGCP